MGIEFKAAFGDQEKLIEISAPSGAGGVFHLTIDKYHNGQIVAMSDGWHVYFNNDDYTAADEDILIDLMRDLKLI